IFPREGLSGISPSFPGLFRTKGYVPTCYSPVCRSPPSSEPFGPLDFATVPSKRAYARSKSPPRNPPSSLEGGALDLHVLGLPPAFALSQDQTLKLDENFSRPITTFDEVPLLPLARQGC